MSEGVGRAEWSESSFGESEVTGLILKRSIGASRRRPFQMIPPPKHSPPFKLSDRNSYCRFSSVLQFNSYTLWFNNFLAEFSQ